MGLDLRGVVRAHGILGEIRARPGGAVGCCAHIVTDDGNVSDDHAEWCLQRAVDSDHADCVALCELLQQMSPTQRRKLHLRGYDAAVAAWRREHPEDET